MQTATATATDRAAATTTVTLSNRHWEAIRCAVLCFACDERRKGNSEAATHFLDSYLELKATLD